MPHWGPMCVPGPLRCGDSESLRDCVPPGCVRGYAFSREWTPEPLLVRPGRACWCLGAGCGSAHTGACSVQVDTEPLASCSQPTAASLATQPSGPPRTSPWCCPGPESDQVLTTEFSGFPGTCVQLHHFVLTLTQRAGLGTPSLMLRRSPVGWFSAALPTLHFGFSSRRRW